MKRSGEVGARVETTSNARTAMDQITRQLRSQVCAKRTLASAPRSLAAASPTSVSVYADFSNEPLTNGLLPAPDLRTLTWENDVFTETVTKGNRSTSGDNVVSYPGTPTTKRTVLTNTVPVDFTPVANPTAVVFRYFKFRDLQEGESILPPGSTPTVEIAPNLNRALTDVELGSVAKITVAFRVKPRSGSPKGATTLKNEVYVRTADPNANAPKPTCLTY
jgi:hypothetical protein